MRETGIITTSGLFYTGLMPTNNRLFSEAGVLAMENEASVLFVIASVRGIKAGCIVAADGPCFEFVGSERSLIIIRRRWRRLWKMRL